jgi:hypothetical protein
LYSGDRPAERNNEVDILNYDMTGQGDNNLSKGQYRGGEEVDDEFVPADALPLCPNRLRPCNPLQNYCENCDSNEVINPLASYMPFVRIRFNVGMLVKLGRSILYDKDISIMRMLFYLFMAIVWLLTFPV